MKNRRSKLIFVILGLILVGLIAWLIYYELDRNVYITFCDVGQGDGILIRQGRTQLIVDGGQANGRMVDCVARQLPPWDRKIELMVATHPDADHIGGLVELLKTYQVDHVVDNGQAGETELAAEFADFGQGKNFSAKRGDLIRLGEISLRVLWPEEIPLQVLGESEPASDRNDQSVVLLFDYDRFELLLTGDAGVEVEKNLEPSPVEVLKVSHHGSKTGTSAELMEQTQPGLAVIGVGQNWYGHPDETVLARLEQMGTLIKRTDRDGAVKLVTDGQTWRIVGR